MVQNLLLEAPFWIGWIVSILVLLLSIYVAWKSWFGDRARGRRRCPHCWYDMAYTEGMTCSECGYCARKESDFERTRRRRLRGFLAVLVAVTVIIFARERTMGDGWAGVLPSRVLIWSLPLFNDADNGAVAQIFSRMSQGRLSEDNLRRLINRCARGDGGSHLGTAPWARKYGTIIDRFRPALAARRQGSELYELEELLLDIPPLISLRSREHWPLGSSPRVNIHVLNWWPFGSESRLVITPQGGNEESVTVYFRGFNPLNTAYSLQTPPLDLDDTEIVIEIESSRRTTQLGDDWTPITTQTMTVPVIVEGDVASMIKSVGNPRMDQVIQGAMFGVWKWIGGPHRLRFYVSPRQTAIPLFTGVAIGFKAEVLHDGEVVYTDYSWWLGGETAAGQGFGSWTDDPNLEVFRDVDFTQGDWKLHIKSDPLLAIRAGEAAEYWEGEFTIPLPYSERPGLAPTPHWWQDERELQDRDLEEN